MADATAALLAVSSGLCAIGRIADCPSLSSSTGETLIHTTTWQPHFAATHRSALSSSPKPDTPSANPLQVRSSVHW